MLCLRRSSLLILSRTWSRTSSHSPTALRCLTWCGNTTTDNVTLLQRPGYSPNSQKNRGTVISVNHLHCFIKRDTACNAIFLRWHQYFIFVCPVNISLWRFTSSVFLVSLSDGDGNGCFTALNVLIFHLYSMVVDYIISSVSVVFYWDFW